MFPQTSFCSPTLWHQKRAGFFVSRTGASLKLTILNEKGRVWTMVAGGGASVVYADTVADYGMGHELANYGEYSGAPSTEELGVVRDRSDRSAPAGKIGLVENVMRWRRRSPRLFSHHERKPWLKALFLLVFTGESSFQGFSGGENGFVHPQYGLPWFQPGAWLVWLGWIDMVLPF